MGALTTVLPMESSVVPLESSVVLFLKHFSTSGSRPWDSFAPTKGNSLPAKRCRPVHIWSCLCLSEHKRVVLHDHFNSSVVFRVSLVWTECWRAASELNWGCAKPVGGSSSCHCRLVAAAQELLRYLRYGPCFRAHHSILGTHKYLFGHTQMPFGAPTNAQKCIFYLSGQMSTL